MNNPTKAARSIWQSAALTNGQTYRFLIRAATAVWPDAVETGNTDEHAAAPNSDVRATPTLFAEVI